MIDDNTYDRITFRAKELYQQNGEFRQQVDNHRVASSLGQTHALIVCYTAWCDEGREGQLNSKAWDSIDQ